MTTIAPDPIKLRELEEETRGVWKAYLERLQALDGEEYDRAESESWTILQGELRRLERRKRLLSVPAPRQL